MLRALFIILTFCIANEANALTCNMTCGTGNCAHLSYFLNNCAHCGNIKEKCSTDFCQNNPNLCEGNVPLPNLSINTHEITSDGKALDVCMAQLFPPMILINLRNGDLNINNLNTTDITTFAQTGGKSEQIKYERNLGILKKLMANYLVYQRPNLKDDPALTVRVEQELTVTYHRNIDHLTLLDFHTIAEDLRRKIFNLKGVETQLRVETYQGKNYPMTVSKMGCTGEVSTVPLSHPPAHQIQQNK